MSEPNVIRNWQENLALHAERADCVGEWPEGSWNELMRAGAGAWSIPREFGGQGLSQREQLCNLEAISESCVTTTLIFSQREAAIRHVLRGPEHLKWAYLPDLAAGRSFITIGLSQLTTSRQHTAPSLRASRVSESRFLLDGEIPWVTGAGQAVGVVIGATLDGGEQVILMLPVAAAGVKVGAPLHLSALVGSQTCSIHCERVEVDASAVLAGPSERVLGGGGGGGLETSCLAIGLSRAAAGFLRNESETRAELKPIVEKITSQVAELHARMLSLAESRASDDVLSLRADCTLLSLRSTQAALLFAKGTGFVRPHAVQRWARQALFFLVWSCPRSVSEQVSRGLLAVEK